VILARYHGLSEGDIRDIHVASLLHDVGKIGVDDAVLKKPGKLTPEEFEVMKLHTVIGSNIMSPIRQMKRLLPGLRSHHERWGGEGYPDALAGDAIPLMARIIAVADSFDAMTTDRPYQKGMDFEKALARVNELKGTAFDERIVESFNRAYHAGEFRKETGARVARVARVARDGGEAGAGAGLRSATSPEVLGCLVVQRGDAARGELGEYLRELSVLAAYANFGAPQPRRLQRLQKVEGALV
jgi:response regulator RpfG family c-di-GMP phosphodiesterase